MTITGGSGISKDEIDRMVKEAESHAAEDKKRREEADTRNSAEQLVYGTEKLLKDNADKIPADVSTSVQTAVDDLKKALEGDDFDAITTAQSKVTEEAQKIGQALYNQGQAEQAAGEQAPAGESPNADEDVVDAEIVDDEEEKK